ncbi:hypothetical protein GBF38_017223, partial [Nibea albiflora]
MGSRASVVPELELSSLCDYGRCKKMEGGKKKRQERSSHGVPGRLPGLYFSTLRKLSATVLGVLEIMETWFLNHVLGLSLAVLLLGLPPPLGAGTPGNNSTDSVTAGFDYSDEVSDVGNNATSTSHSSESLSPSQRNILLTHNAETHTAAAGNF